MNIENEIAGIFAPVSPKKIIMFGSRAKESADEYSDVDLIVVYETDKRFLDRLEELYLIWELPVAVDILAYTPEEFERMKEESSFVADAVAGGKVLYEEPAG